METWDAVVIGGGIAGVSAGAELSRAGRRVLVVEMERQLALHATGRSAALYVENYGHRAVRPLIQASRAVFESPPWADHPLIGPVRGALTVATTGQRPTLERQAAEASGTGTEVDWLTGREAARLAPCLRAELVEAALFEAAAADLDVAGVHQMYVRALRGAGGEIRTESAVTGLGATGSGWEVAWSGGRVLTQVVVNAAGAWGDRVAALGGIAPVGLTPLRRTAFMVPGHQDWSHWPAVVGALHDFYFKPDGVQLLCSPSEEMPAEPGDPQPREEDIALAIERINAVTTLEIRAVRSSWTGLRTFAPDRAMVIGEDPEAAGFFWLVGQGGTGIESAPGAAQLLASLVTEGRAPAHLARVDLARLSPDRLR